jgi:hypothetical protein
MVKKIKYNNTLFIILIISLILLSSLYYFYNYKDRIIYSKFNIKKENFNNNTYYTLTKKSNNDIESFLGFMEPKNTPLDDNQNQIPEQLQFNKNQKIENIVNTPTSINTNNIPDLVSKTFNKNIPDGGVKPIQLNVQKVQSKPPLNMENIFKKMECGFHQKCPNGYKSMGNLGISGYGVSLSCNGSLNSRNAKAYGIIKNGIIEKIVLIDEGSGYLPNSKPNITIEGNGGGAMAEAIVDDNGQIKVIHLIQGGSGYTETPEIIIQSPNNNNGCEFCCKLN